MPDYDSWESLTAAAQAKCRVILDKNIAPVAKDILKKHIKTDIYDAYTPIKNGWVNGQTYKRRHVLEGSVYHSFIADNEILVTSNATASKAVIKGYSFHNRRPGSFLKLLEVGNMGIWAHGFPRPAVGNAQAEINKSSAIKAAIRAGIAKQFN